MVLRLIWILLFFCAAMTWFAGLEEARWPILVKASFLSAILVFWRWRYAAEVSFRELVFVAIALRLLVFPIPPGLSDDNHRYLWDGQLIQEGINPYLHLPSSDELAEFRGDREGHFERLNSKEFYSVYPPVSQFVFWLGSLSGDWGLYGIKLLFGLAELAGLLVLIRLAQNHRAVLLYAWNPVVILESWGQAHTECVALVAMLVSLLALRNHWKSFAVFAMTIAIWTKIFPILFLPLLIRNVGWTRAILIPAVTTVVLWIPFADPAVPTNFKSSLDLYLSHFEFNAGPYLSLKAISGATALGMFVSDTGPLVGAALRVVLIGSTLAIYWAYWKKKIELVSAMALILSAYFLTSTTVHPWYLLPLLALVPLIDRIWWSWLAFGVISHGTYLYYSHDFYWPFVWAAWGIWLGLTWWQHSASWLQGLMRWRAREKASRLAQWIAPDTQSILDLGAGEGYVGERLATLFPEASVQLVDVLPMNRTGLPHHVYDGSTLPFEDDSFDTVVIVYTLHHCEDAIAVLHEAKRVAKNEVVVLESVYGSPLQHKVLNFSDRLANRLRSAGAMEAQEEHLHFRPTEEWHQIAKELGFRVEHCSERGPWFHRKASLALRN